MSEFQALIDALNNHTKALDNFVKASAKGGTTAAATETKAAATKPAAKPATKPGIKQEDVAERFGAYLKVKDKAELAERVSHVKAINAHFELAKITEGTPAQWKEALAMLDQYEAGEDPFADAGDGEDDGDGESLV